jgi:hypothetical protein
MLSQLRGARIHPHSLIYNNNPAVTAWPPYSNRVYSAVGNVPYPFALPQADVLTLSRSNASGIEEVLFLGINRNFNTIDFLCRLNLYNLPAEFRSRHLLIEETALFVPSPHADNEGDVMNVTTSRYTVVAPPARFDPVAFSFNVSLRSVVLVRVTPTDPPAATTATTAVSTGSTTGVVGASTAGTTAVAGTVGLTASTTSQVDPAGRIAPASGLSLAASLLALCMGLWR